MGCSPGGAIPYLDRVPLGVIEMVGASGATLLPSGDLVTRFFARWTEHQLARHREAAELLADIARSAFALVRDCRANAQRVTESEIQTLLIERIAQAGLQSDYPPIVAAGEHTADVHYEPSVRRPRLVCAGDVLLIDLWRATLTVCSPIRPGWVSLIPRRSRVREVWDAECASRNATIEFLRNNVERGIPTPGATLHDVARRVLTERGFGAYAVGRTGHSIDTRQLHGAGPNIDNTETPETRLLVSGLGFSIEPGIYIPGEFGIRSEVNAYIGDRTLVVTPRDYQRELLVV